MDQRGLQGSFIALSLRLLRHFREHPSVLSGSPPPLLLRLLMIELHIDAGEEEEEEMKKIVRVVNFSDSSFLVHF